jgi:hypothetical protein
MWERSREEAYSAASRDELRQGQNDGWETDNVVKHCCLNPATAPVKSTPHSVDEFLLVQHTLHTATELH